MPHGTVTITATTALVRTPPSPYYVGTVNFGVPPDVFGPDGAKLNFPYDVTCEDPIGVDLFTTDESQVTFVPTIGVYPGGVNAYFWRYQFSTSGVEDLAPAVPIGALGTAPNVLAKDGILPNDFVGRANFANLNGVPLQIVYAWQPAQAVWFPNQQVFQYFGGAADSVVFHGKVNLLWCYAGGGSGGGTPPGPDAEGGVLGCNGYDVSDAQTHWRARSVAGTVVVGRNDNLRATVWDEITTLLAGSCPAVRIERQNARQRLWLAVDQAAAIVRAYTDDGGGSVTVMGTVFANGHRPAMVLTRDGRHCYYSRSAGSAIQGVILDAFGGTVVAPFTAVSGPVDNDCIVAAEYTTGGGQNAIKLEYVVGGAIIDVSSFDGIHFA